jgi:hypothetical protein
MITLLFIMHGDDNRDYIYMKNVIGTTKNQLKSNFFPTWQIFILHGIMAFKKKKNPIFPKSVVSPEISETGFSSQSLAPALSLPESPLSPPALILSSPASSSDTGVYQSLALPPGIIPLSPPALTLTLSRPAISSATGVYHSLSLRPLSLSLRRSFYLPRSCISHSPPPTVSNPSVSSLFKI